MKSRDLMVKSLASKFCKEFTKLAPEFELPDRIVFTECLIELLAIRNQAKVNESHFQKIYRSTKFKKFSIAATQQLLSYFDREGVLMYKGLSETDESLVSQAEFAAMPSEEEQTLSKKEFTYLSWSMNNVLNSDLVSFRTELHNRNKIVKGEERRVAKKRPQSFFAKNRTKCFAFIYAYLHESKDEPYFENNLEGKEKAIIKLAKARKISPKNFQNHYNRLTKKGYDRRVKDNKEFIKCASAWLLKKGRKKAFALAYNDFHYLVQLG